MLSYRRLFCAAITVEFCEPWNTVLTTRTLPAPLAPSTILLVTARRNDLIVQHCAVVTLPVSPENEICDEIHWNCCIQSSTAVSFIAVSSPMVIGQEIPGHSLNDRTG